MDIKTVANEIDVPVKELYTIRNKGKRAKESLYKKLLEKFPTFVEKQTDTVNDAMIMVSDGRAWKELADTQKKLLEALEHRILKQDEEIRDLKAEVRYLRERCLELEKKNV